jgi:predicted N-acetyltransferase YhbS
MNLQLIDEFCLTSGQRLEIQQLLLECFPDCEFAESRTYLKQLPQRRLLAIHSAKLIGHLGLEHRVIGFDGEPGTILGVLDVCVTTTQRGQRIASSMLQYVEELARRFEIEFLMLFARDARLYERNGFVRADNPLRWVKIDEHRTIGIAEQPLVELMIKPLTTRPWPAGLVDLLGYQF